MFSQQQVVAGGHLASEPGQPDDTAGGAALQHAKVEPVQLAQHPPALLVRVERSGAERGRPQHQCQLQLLHLAAQQLQLAVAQLLQLAQEGRQSAADETRVHVHGEPEVMDDSVLVVEQLHDISQAGQRMPLVGATQRVPYHRAGPEPAAGLLAAPSGQVEHVHLTAELLGSALLEGGIVGVGVVGVMKSVYKTVIVAPYAHRLGEAQRRLLPAAAPTEARQLLAGGQRSLQVVEELAVETEREARNLW